METLIVGNIQYWTEELLRKAFGNDHLVLVGEVADEQRKKLWGKNIVFFPISVSDEKMREIFQNYNFDRVVYVSEYLTFHGEKVGELENLRRILQLCREMHTEQIVYLLSAEVCSDIQTGKTILLTATEQLCHYYMEESWMPIKIIRVPFLGSGTIKKDYFYKLFQKINKKEKIEIMEEADQMSYFITMNDLADFLFRLFDSWNDSSEVLNLFGRMDRTFGDLAASLSKLSPEIEIVHLGRSPMFELQLGENVIRKKYGWFAKEDLYEETESMYQEYLSSIQKKQSVFTKVMEKLFRVKTIVSYIELFLGWVLIEVLASLLGTSVQFRMIDVRLLFIVVMGSMYGTTIGVLSAVLEIVAVVISHIRSGMNWQTLFYDPTNWVPFLLYLVTGAICGYIKKRNEDSIAFVQEENQNIQEKYFFIEKMYEKALENKNKYKQQIIGSRDSFGKIFEVVRQLDSMVKQEIFTESIPVLEDVLKNRSIAIYSINEKDSVFGRLEVASQPMISVLPKSINLNEYRHSFGTLEQGEVWFNKELLAGYPMYMAGVKRDDRLALLIMIYRAEYSQMGMYYANLIRILCGLIERSFLRALEYQEILREKMYVEGTVITKEEFFVRELEAKHTMFENRISNYRLIKINSAGRTVYEMDQLLRGKVRYNDLMGLGSDGNIYVILNQVEDEQIQIVLNRFRKTGLTCELIQISDLQERKEDHD